MTFWVKWSLNVQSTTKHSRSCLAFIPYLSHSSSPFSIVLSLLQPAGGSTSLLPTTFPVPVCPPFFPPSLPSIHSIKTFAQNVSSTTVGPSSASVRTYVCKHGGKKWPPSLPSHALHSLALTPTPSLGLEGEVQTEESLVTLRGCGTLRACPTPTLFLAATVIQVAKLRQKW